MNHLVRDGGGWREVAWPLALAAAAVSGSLAVACMMPFVAVAVLAAATLRREAAVTTVLGCWAANQLLGFGLLGYPRTAEAVGWGAALAGAAVAATFVARAVFRRAGDGLAAGVVAFAAAFAAYELLLFAVALVAGGLETFVPAIVSRILVSDAGSALALAAFHALLVRAAPRLFAPAAAA